LISQGGFNLQELEKKLTRQLLSNPNIQLKHVESWSITVQSIEVEFKPVKRLKMDVLMKMLLLTLQQAEIESVSELSELLIVEQLFIEDLLSKLLRMGLIGQIDGSLKLTAKGEQQLNEGIFEEQQALQKQTLLYSPCHQLFIEASIDELDMYDELPELYRYVQEDADNDKLFAEDHAREALQKTIEPSEETNEQMIVADILATKELQINDVPCLEFILYNRETDTFYVRVWNALFAKWDDILEKQLTEREVVQWREVYLS